MTDLPEHVRRNRAHWDSVANEWVEPGRVNWQQSEPHWGVWQIPESEAHLLPDVAGLDVIELGCGTGYVSSWLARRGARPVGIDNSPRQLETARGFQEEFGIEFPLILGNAEEVPLPDASFDLAISEYGAAIWALDSRSSTQTPSGRRSATQASTWPSRNTARPSGATRIGGSPKRRGSSVPTVSWCSSAIPTSRC